jgi:hypothetical protein
MSRSTQGAGERAGERVGRAIAEVPFAAGAVYLGDTFVRRQYLPLLAIAVGGLALSAVAIHLLHRRLERCRGRDRSVPRRFPQHHPLD